MRKTIFGLLAVVAVALMAVSPADAGQRYHHKVAKPVVIGAVVGTVVGTVVGIGLYDGWWSGSVATSLGATTGGAITGGLIAGVATATAIHAVTTPCQGFHALFGGKNCKNGKYVGKQYHRHAFLFW